MLLWCRRLRWCEEYGPTVKIRTGPGPPDPPVGLITREVTPDSILLHWQQPVHDNGLPVLEYTVWKKAMSVQAEGEYDEEDGGLLSPTSFSRNQDSTPLPPPVKPPGIEGKVDDRSAMEKDGYVLVQTSRDRVHLAAHLSFSTVYVFQVSTCSHHIVVIRNECRCCTQSALIVCVCRMCRYVLLTVQVLACPAIHFLFVLLQR